MIAGICQSTGWTWDYVENAMTLPRLDALSRRWRHCPPAHQLLAALAGWRGTQAGNSNLAELMALAGADGRIR